MFGKAAASSLLSIQNVQNIMEQSKAVGRLPSVAEWSLLDSAARKGVTDRFSQFLKAQNLDWIDDFDRGCVMWDSFTEELDTAIRELSALITVANNENEGSLQSSLDGLSATWKNVTRA